VKKNPYVSLTDKTLTVVVDGKAHHINNDHPKWQQAKAAIVAEEWEKLWFYTSSEPRQTYAYEFHTAPTKHKDIGIIHEKAKEGWRVHTILRNSERENTFTLLFEREVN